MVDNSKLIKKLDKEIYNLSARLQYKLLDDLMNAFAAGGAKAMMPQYMSNEVIQRFQLNVHALLNEIPAEQLPLFFAVMTLDGAFGDVRDKEQLKKVVSLETLYEKATARMGARRFAEANVSFGQYVVLEGMLPAEVRAMEPRPYRIPTMATVLNTAEYFEEACQRVNGSAMAGLRASLPVGQGDKTISELVGKSAKLRSSTNHIQI